MFCDFWIRLVEFDLIACVCVLVYEFTCGVFCFWFAELDLDCLLWVICVICLWFVVLCLWLFLFGLFCWLLFHCVLFACVYVYFVGFCWFLQFTRDC